MRTPLNNSDIDDRFALITRDEARRIARGQAIGIVCFLIGLLILVGCANRVVGGEARKEVAAFRATVQSPDGHKVEVSDDRDRVATTQATVTSYSDTIASIGEAKLGDLGGVSIKTAAKNWKLAGGLGLIFLGVGFFAWKSGSPVFGLFCGACAVLSFLAPLILAWVAGIIVVYFLATRSTIIQELVNGARDAFEDLPPEQVERAKLAMSKAQRSKQTRKAVRLARGKSV